MTSDGSQRLKKFGKWALHEFIQVWIMTTYFAIGLSLILLLQNLLLANQGSEQIGYYGALILALLIGKVVIVIDNMAFVKVFRRRRRIGHVIYSTFIFTGIALLVGTIEKVIKRLIDGDTFGSALTGAYDDASLTKFLATTIALLMLFGMLFFVREVNHILGKGVLLKAFFQRPETQ